MRITTGAQSYEKSQEQTNWGNQPQINMFKIQGLYPIFLRQNKPFNGVILPAFDSSLDVNDTTRQASYEAYRSRTDVDQKTGYGQFTGWFTTVMGYSYYGLGKSTFISPSTLGLPDPIIDLRIHVYGANKRLGDSTYMYLTENKDPKSGPTELPRTSRMSLVNVWSGTTNEKAKDQSVTNRILVIREQAFTKLRQDLDTMRPASVENPVDPDWPHFLYGDITSPTRGAIQFSTMTYTPPNGGFSGPALNLGEMRYNAGRHEVNITRVPITQQMLEGRYDLGDADNVLHIPTYEEIVDLLVAEQLIPYELLQTVCSAKYAGNFPANPAYAKKASTYSTQPSAEIGQVMPMSNNGGAGLRMTTQKPAARTEAPESFTQRAPYTTTPTPAVPVQRQSSLFDDEQDEIPGLGPINDEVPAFNSAPVEEPQSTPAAISSWTDADERLLQELNDKINSNKMDIDDINKYRDLMTRKAAAGL